MHIPTLRAPRASILTRVAIGAAALVTGGVLFTTSPLGASGADDTTFVAITPCRLFDTRPEPQTVGDRGTPLGPDESLTVQARGARGDCTIPNDATALALNATAVGATQVSYATFFPADAERPHSSSLNYGPGGVPTPNAIDVRLSADGRFTVYNAFGAVDLVGDVTGYYARGTLDELTAAVATKADASDVYTRAEIDALLAGLPAALLAGLPDGGYTDAEIDALLNAKADRAAVYAQHEVDAAIAAAVAGKADAADVYTKAEVYSKAELDVLHQLLYTKDEVDDLIYTEDEIDALLQQVYSKDEVDDLLVDERVWLASLASNGDEIGTGFTSTRLGVGVYRATFQLSVYDFPSSTDPIFSALPRCGSGTATNTAIFKNVAAGEVASVIVEIETRNTAGALIDCPLHIMMRMTD